MRHPMGLRHPAAVHDFSDVVGYFFFLHVHVPGHIHMDADDYSLCIDTLFMYMRRARARACTREGE